MFKKIREGLSAVAAFGKDLDRLRHRLEDLESSTEGHLTHLEHFERRQSDLEHQMKTTTLEHAELYGKTYKLLKRMQMEDQRAEEEPDIQPVDPVSERVLARRNKHGISRES